ncbi:glycosyltransferase family 2 protein [Acidithiobacillus thiooxidans]|uniref:Glycosyltransferase 2-like domain-containing protein n=1 Tax=Acidithiobacillus thiooxidans TaxID=930 RepID=A0A1C2IDY7_ACITH|nr:glycosyltransferase [Acidithiobacillus thiooxidans]OCX74198.1 hypothetical protein A6M23_06405 [Acidithiobacillus thiooxidans]OCX87048.1 hypothetical protein A6P08_04330 [Acidithiobacillus thiooxidans]
MHSLPSQDENNKKVPAVTVILPVYNGCRRSPDFMIGAIQSVVDQNYEDFELIIVDDGSEEDYTSIIAQFSYDTRVRWVKKENEGQSAARNFGARLGSGKWLAFIDQDDYWYPNRLEMTVCRMQEERRHHINCVMVYSDLDQIDARSRILCQNYLATRKLGTHPKKRLEDIIAENAFILPGTMLVERETFLELGGFDLRLSGYEDDELALRFFYRGRIVFIDNALIQWRIYPESYSYSSRMEVSRKFFWEILIQAHPDEETVNKLWVRDYIAPRFYYEWLHAWRNAVIHQNREQSRRACAGLKDVAKFLPVKKRIKAYLASVFPFNIACNVFKTKIARRLAYFLL